MDIFKFAVEVEYPHTSAMGYVLHYTTLEQAKESAEATKAGTPGHAGYKRVRIYQLIEEVN